MDGDGGEGRGFVGRAGLGRMRAGHRVWPADVKGRIVRESLRPGARVCDVARKYGLRAQQLTVWRRAARSGHLAVISDDNEADVFVPIEISDTAARNAPEARIEISVGKVVLRVQSDMSSLRLAEIVAALERQP
jgi:transposase